MFNEIHTRDSRSGSFFIAGMGTKIEYAIDPLAATSLSNNTGFTVHGVNDWDYFQTRELKKFQPNNFRNSMDRMLEKHNIESIKRTMQIHEDIFKHQVQELHRLYSVQKMLMAELKKEMTQNNRIRSTSMGGGGSSDINNNSQSRSLYQFNKQQQQQITSSGYVFNFQNNVSTDIDHPHHHHQINSRERSGSCSGETMRRIMPRRVIDLARPAEDHHHHEETAVAPGPSKMSIDGGGCEEDSEEVELTLSIGVSSSSSSKKKNRPKSYLQVQSQQELGCSESINKENTQLDSPMSSSSATFDQEKKRPHWLLGLSINRN